MKLKSLLPLYIVTAFCAPISANTFVCEEKQVPVVAKRKIGEGSQTIYIKNMEDYIYVQEEETDPVDLVDQFVQFAKECGYTHAEVVYDTTDTNETLFSELQTGKADYDLICPSDYMIQKMISNDMLYKFTDEDKAMVPNYFGDESYASQRIKNTLDNIKVEKNNELKYLKDYAVGYMWGTLGILFNPEYNTYKKRGIDFDDVVFDMQSWDSLWDKKYKNTLSIKDSMRDTYCVGVMETYKNELEIARNTYLSEKEINEEDALNKYQEVMDEIFNRSEQKYIDEVQPVLEKLKGNSFGLECDSGKEDIISGKIGINLAWSGDAVYSMDQAEDEERRGENGTFELYYAIPELGSNIWFDAWVMPKNDSRSQAQKELALMFLNFISDPVNAAQNMNYIGYTPFIGGAMISDLVKDWYDYRTNYIYATEDYFQVYYFNETEEEYVAIDYSDFFEERTANEALVYFEEMDEEENPIGDPVEFLDPMWEEEGDAPQLHYNDLIAALDGIEEVDLTYFFDGTLHEDDIEEGYSEDDFIFYSDCYLPFTYEDEKGNEVQNISVGRQFFCQFPDIETINRCCVMRDYGENNKLIMYMWENFKSDALPVWATVLFIVEGTAIVGGISWFLVRKRIKLNIRHKRKQRS